MFLWPNFFHYQEEDLLPRQCDVAPDELDLSRLFYEVHTRHNHAQVNKFMQV